MKIKTGLGIDSHRFVEDGANKPLILGGLVFEDAPGLSGNSDADVILHALTDAISGISGHTVIGDLADAMCESGITDSKEYLKAALDGLSDWKLSHVSIALECKRPKIAPKVSALRESIAGLLGLTVDDVCVTATTGESLTEVGRGRGIHATAIVTATR